MHCTDQLVDIDCAVVIRVVGRAARRVFETERDIHADQQFVDADRAAVVAISEAEARRTGRCTDSEQEQQGKADGKCPRMGLPGTIRARRRCR